MQSEVQWCRAAASITQRNSSRTSASQVRLLSAHYLQRFVIRSAFVRLSQQIRPAGALKKAPKLNKPARRPLLQNLGGGVLFPAKTPLGSLGTAFQGAVRVFPVECLSEACLTHVPSLSEGRCPSLDLPPHHTHSIKSTPTPYHPRPPYLSLFQPAVCSNFGALTIAPLLEYPTTPS